MRVWVLWVVLAGCRIGFDRLPGDDVADDIADPGMTEVRVLSDAYADDPAGAPITGATVLVDRGAGIVERLQTGADGSARFVADGVAFVHAVHHGDLGWRVYTVAAPSGVIELGGRPGALAEHTMTVLLPDDGATDYQLTIPTRCGFPAPIGGAKVVLSYAAACEGQTVRALAVEHRLSEPRYLDVAALPLIAGSTVTAPGAYRTEPTVVLGLQNQGTARWRVGAQLVLRTDNDLLPRAPAYEVSLSAGAGTAALEWPFAPDSNFLDGTITSEATPAAYISRTEVLQPRPVAGDTTSVGFAAADFLVPWQRIELTQPPSLSWAPQAGGTITVVETSSDLVQWDAYLEPTATAALWPALPADLGVPTPAAFHYAQVSKLDVPGATRAQLLPTIDRRWQQWPADALLLPAGGGAFSSVLYSAGLGPP